MLRVAGTAISPLSPFSLCLLSTSSLSPFSLTLSPHFSLSSLYFILLHLSPLLSLSHSLSPFSLSSLYLILLDLSPFSLSLSLSEHMYEHTS